MKNRHSAPETAPEPALSSSGSAPFWDTENVTEPAEYRKRFSDQIARLQERQLEMVKQTAEELETLKREFEESKDLEEKVALARQPLVIEVQNLQTAVQQLQQHNALLEEQLKIAQSGYQAQYAQLQGVISGLKNAMRAQAQSFDQQLRVFSMDATQSLESMLNTLEVTELPALNVPQTPLLPKAEPVAVKDPQPEAFRRHEEKLQRVIEKEKPLHKKGVRRFAVRSLLAVGLLAAGFGGWKALIHLQQRNVAASLATAANTGTVAGVSTDSSVTTSTPTDEYPESFVDLPYAETKWATLTDPIMGISMQYPQNTSDKARPLGGNNLWILRKNGYLMEFTEDSTVSTLVDWQTENQSALAGTYTTAQGTFKGLPALIMTPITHTDTSGTEYAIVQDNFVLTIWVKDEDPSSDDGKRVVSMLNSLTFSKPTVQ